MNFRSSGVIQERLSARDSRLLNKAIELALTSQCNPRTRHGAIIVAGGRALGRGVNKDRNNPEFVKCGPADYAVHAEIVALRSCGNTPVKGGKIYIARVGSKGLPAMSKPCSRCMAALKNAGITKIIYTIESVRSI